MDETSHPAQTAPDIDPAYCRWGCGRLHAPRQGDRGPEPKDCLQADPGGGPVHNPLNWWRRNKAAGAAPGPAVDERAPVDTARKDARTSLEQAQQLGARLVDQLQLFIEALRVSADPDAVAAQIDAALADAQEA